MNSRRQPLEMFSIAKEQVVAKDGSRELKRKIKAPGNAHAGLWYDKYLDQQVAQSSQSFEPYTTGLTPYQQLVKTVSQFTMQPRYKIFFDRWKETLENNEVYLYEAGTRGRQVIGLGGAGVIENAITLHYTYGVPYLPGSALKGLAAHYAHNYLGADWNKSKEAHKHLFGTQKQAGLVTFHDALPSAYTFEPDILTVHHQDYYQKGKTPADWDNPVPIPFLTVTRGVFHIPLAGPEAWVKAASVILRGALSELGIGAKTSSGYGRMKIQGVDNPEKPPQLITLEKETVIPTIVKEIGEENIYLYLDFTRFSNVPEDAGQLVYLEKAPSQTYKEGQEIQCFVLNCDINDSDIFVECQPVVENK